MVAATAEGFNVPLVGLAALGQAESNWRRTAERWGIWPDWSFGYGQITVALAVRYGIGDGTPDSALEVRDALFDGLLNLEISAAYYAHSLRRAQDHFPGIEGDDWLLQGLIAYNSGSPQPEGNWYWTDPRWAQNIASYRAALAWAHGVID